MTTLIPAQKARERASDSFKKREQLSKALHELNYAIIDACDLGNSHTLFSCYPTHLRAIIEIELTQKGYTTILMPDAVTLDVSWDE